MNKILGFFLLVSLIFVSPVFAGGGLISFESSPALVRPGEQYVVRPKVYSDNNGNLCKSCPIIIKFENTQTGDVINQSDSKTDENGTMYAKVISQQSGERIIYAEVTMPGGTSYQSSRYVLYYEAKAEPIGSIVVRVDGQRILGGDVRQVSLSWNSIPEAYYLVFVRPVNNSYGAALAQTNNLNATVTINTSPNYYVKVSACNSYGRCIESSEVLVPELKAATTPVPVVSSNTYNTKVTTSETTKAKSFTSPIQVVAPTASSSDKKVEELNTKIDNLQGQLEESKMKQNALESKINELVSWIKSLFPFFK